jgi:arylsulfatase A-like enzyme
MGQRDLGVTAARFTRRQHLDSLAREGARFTDAYAACPVCSPTRASIMTGQWPQRTGSRTIFPSGRQPAGAVEPQHGSPPAPYSDRLALDSPTLAKALKDAGYATFFAGKWHLGPEGFWPENQGFDVNMGGIDRGGPYGGKQYFSPYGNPRLSDGPTASICPIGWRPRRRSSSKRTRTARSSPTSRSTPSTRR